MLTRCNSVLAPDQFAFRTDPGDLDIDLPDIGGKVKGDVFPGNVTALPGITVDEGGSGSREARSKDKCQDRSAESNDPADGWFDFVHLD